mmetsp:Transcript_13475/g.31690  ORF Transcript_13475/g.31690 Transcript_13475/m.31690 type:complete len:378 (-) Transcript_13475:34-1167(-)
MESSKKDQSNVTAPDSDDTAQQQPETAVQEVPHKRSDASYSFDYRDAPPLKFLSAKESLQAKGSMQSMQSSAGMSIQPMFSVGRCISENKEWNFERSGGLSGLKRTNGGTVVTLNIYDMNGTVLVRTANALFRVLGTGAFHCAVEVYGTEWSYGYGEGDQTGIFESEPTKWAQAAVRETVSMGQTSLRLEQVWSILEEMEGEWLAKDYDLIRRNCTTFSDDFCNRLGVGAIPTWVRNLAGAGCMISNGVSQLVNFATRGMIVQSAKEQDGDHHHHHQLAVKAKDILHTVDDTLHILLDPHHAAKADGAHDPKSSVFANAGSVDASKNQTPRRVCPCMAVFYSRRKPASPSQAASEVDVATVPVSPSVTGRSEPVDDV